MVDVVVIGAGQAGMAAADRLSKQGLSVHVIEATDHVGGRTRNYDVATDTTDVATDNVFEMGGTWLSPSHTATLGLCQEYGLDVFNGSFVNFSDPPYAPMDTDYEWWYWGLDYPADQRARIKHIVVHTESGWHTYRKPSELLAALNETTNQDLQRAGEELDAIVATIDDQCWEIENVSDSWISIDRDTTASRLHPLLTTDEAQTMHSNCVHDSFAHEPESLSLLYRSMSYKGCNSDGPGSQYRVRWGTQAIPIKIAEALGSDRVSLGSPVRVVEVSNGTVRAYTQDGLVVEAKAAIVTGPPPAVLGIEFRPKLSGANAQMLQRMPMGASTKFVAIYEEGQWWRDLGFQGDIIAMDLPNELSMPDSSHDFRRPLFVNCVDHSPYSRNYGVICCFIEGRQNLYFETLSEARKEELFKQFLELSFNTSRAREGVRFVGHNWIDEPYARGAYTSYMAPGLQSVPEYWAAYRTQEKLPNVFLAGSEYHTGFGNGWIEGAVRSGQRAADAVLARLGNETVVML